MLLILLWGVHVHTVAVRRGVWEKSNILILRSIVCEIPFCCPKSVTVSLIRNDSLGGEGRFQWRSLLSGGEGWGRQVSLEESALWRGAGGVGVTTAEERSFKSWDRILPGFPFLIHFVLSTTQKCLKTHRRDRS